jgi:hypothetical protein
VITLCSNCSSEIPEGAAACQNCGNASVQPPLAPEAAIPPPSAPLFATHEDLEGLSGWLILVGLGLVASPFIVLHTIFAVDAPVLFSAKYQPFLESHQSLALLIVFEIITNIVLLALLAFLLFLFFSKKRAFPRVWIMYMVFQVCVVLADTLAGLAVNPAGGNAAQAAGVFRSIIAAAVWIPYFLVSRRVKATFTH